MEAAHFSESLLRGITELETVADIGSVNTALKRQTLCMLYAVDTVAL
jgi:hypothetical protein